MDAWGYAAGFLALVGNVLLIYRNRVGFAFFAVSDLIWIFYHWGDVPSVLQFCIFFTTAIWGVWRWGPKAAAK
jgi:hypothetical protein